MTNIVLSNLFIKIFIAGTLISFAINHFLEFIDMRARIKNSGKLPDELNGIAEASVFDTEKLARISAYENAKYFFWIPRSICGLALTLILVFSGYYPWLFNMTCRLTGFPSGLLNSYFCALIFFICAGIPSSILSVPFDLIRDFNIEKKFGFSKMTIKYGFLTSLKALHFLQYLPQSLFLQWFLYS